MYHYHSDRRYFFSFFFFLIATISSNVIVYISWIRSYIAIPFWYTRISRFFMGCACTLLYIYILLITRSTLLYFLSFSFYSFFFFSSISLLFSHFVISFLKSLPTVVDLSIVVVSFCLQVEYFYYCAASGFLFSCLPRPPFPFVSFHASTHHTTLPPPLTHIIIHQYRAITVHSVIQWRKGKTNERFSKKNRGEKLTLETQTFSPSPSLCSRDWAHPSIFRRDIAFSRLFLPEMNECIYGISSVHESYYYDLLDK